MNAPDSGLAAARQRQLDHERSRAAHHARRSDLLAPRRPDEELERLANTAADRFSDASTDEVLRWVAKEFGYRTAVACSMADAVLPHVVAQHLPWVDTLFLDTGYHFAETLGTRDAVDAQMALTLIDVTPAPAVLAQAAADVAPLYQRDPERCCRLRKVEPLQQSLRGYEAWVTGVRREESALRAGTPLVSWDPHNGLVKVNPLAAWSFDDLLGYATQHQVIVNPLVQDGYPSIGCAPCTQRVAPGDDPRSGRWAGLAKTECGLHR